MAHIAGSAQVGIRLGAICNPIRFELPDEKQYFTAALLMVDIALSSGRVLCCRALALPVEKAFIDGIVVIHSRWGIVLVSLIERNKEHIQLLLRQPLHALADGCGLHEIHGHQQLIAGIGAVQIQRTIKAQVNRVHQ